MEQVIADVLAGSAGLDGVQWALTGPEPRERLTGALEALLDGARLAGCDLHRAKYKPGRKLTAYYDLRLVAGGADLPARPITVTWEPQGRFVAEVAPELERMQDEAARAGLAEPFSRLVAVLPEQGMRVQIAPLDPRFPQLVRLSEPSHVRDLLATVYGDSPPAPDARPIVTPIRYRPGQRHVLRYDAPRAQGAPIVAFAKLYDGDNGERAYRVASSVADWLATDGKGMTAVRPLAYVAADQTILYPEVVGAPLSHQLRRPDYDAAQHLGVIGAALHALHHAPATLAGELKTNSFEAEVKAIARAAEHVPALLPQAGAQIDALLDRARALHERMPHEPLTFAHGDLKADHIWITASGLTLIDFDTCYMADPAIDLGKFLADLRWWHAAAFADGGDARCAEAQDQFLAGYAAGDAPPERVARARLYEALVLTKLTVRRVRLFDADWAARTTRLVQRAAALLDTVEQQHSRAVG